MLHSGLQHHTQISSTQKKQQFDLIVWKHMQLAHVRYQLLVSNHSGRSLFTLPSCPPQGAFSWGTLEAFSSPPTKANKGSAFSSMAQQATRWWRSDHTTSINGPAKRTWKWCTKISLQATASWTLLKILLIIVMLRKKWQSNNQKIIINKINICKLRWIAIIQALVTTPTIIDFRSKVVWHN